MSVNKSSYGDGIWLFFGERILLYSSGVDLHLSPDRGCNLPSSKTSGKVYLTTHRVVFKSKKGPNLLSVEFPFHALQNVELEQPVFGSNYISGKLKASPDGGYTGLLNFKMYFTHGGAIEFGKALYAVATEAQRYAPTQPVFYPEVNNFYQAPPPPMWPPPAPAYGWLPYAQFPEPPPYQEVYIVDQPPPYGGYGAPPAYQQANTYYVPNATAPPPPPYPTEEKKAL